MNGLRKIEIEGEAYPVFYGMYGFALIMQKTGLDMGQTMQRAAQLTEGSALTGDNLMFLYELIHAGFEVGSQMERKTFPYNVIQLSSILPLDGPEIETIFQAFSDSMPQANGTEPKKQTPQKTKAKGRK